MSVEQGDALQVCAWCILVCHCSRVPVQLGARHRRHCCRVGRSHSLGWSTSNTCVVGPTACWQLLCL
jgi:hypothetical protein